MTQDIRDLITAASDGDEEAVEVLSKAVMLRRALEVLFPQKNLRDALMVIGRYYGEASIEHLTRVFSLSKTSVSKLLNAETASPGDG